MIKKNQERAEPEKVDNGIQMTVNSATLKNGWVTQIIQRLVLTMTNSDIFHQNKEKYGSPALELAFHFSCEAVQGSGVHFAKLDKNAGTGRAARLKTTNKEPPGWFKHYQVKKMMKN